MAEGPVPGLQEAFDKAHLPEGSYPKAVAWCLEQGAKFLWEVSEAENFEELATFLQLKKMEKKRLQSALSGGPEATALPAGAIAAQVPPMALSPGVSPMASHAVPGRGIGYLPARPVGPLCVKNTFLDLPDAPKAPGDLTRAATVPVGSMDAEGDSNDEDDNSGDVADEDQGVSELYKTTTCDMFEQPSEWAWTAAAPLPVAGSSQAQSSQPGLSAAASSASPQGAYEQAAAAAAAAAAAGMVYFDPTMAAAAAQQTGHMMCMLPPGSAIPTGYPMAPQMYFPMDRFSRLPAEAAGAEEPLKPLPLQRAFSTSDTTLLRIRWTVDAKILKSSDREKVSPEFPLAFGAGMQFKMVMKALTVSDEKGGGSFKRAKGKGTIDLRCLNEIVGQSAAVRFRLAIGSGGDPNKQQAPRGPVLHNFAEQSSCGLPEGQQEWDFRKAVDPLTATFVIVLEVFTDVGR